MKFGVAKELITPDCLTPMGGYGSYFRKYFQGIHDDLYARALLLDDGKNPVLLIAVDLLFHDYALTGKVQDYAAAAFGMDRDSLFIAYSHTHGGPSVEGYDEASQVSPEYEAFLFERLKCLIRRALLNTFEGTLAYGLAEGDWNINRRKLLNGKIVNAPNPEGGKDDRLQMLRINDRTGNIKAVLFNYACHPVTVRDTLYLSGDFPARVCHLLEAEYFGATALFFQSAGGNARPKATAKFGEFITCGYDEMNEMAMAMTQSIKGAVAREGAFRLLEPELEARQFRITLALEPFSKQRIIAAIEDAEGFPATKRIAEDVLARYEELPDAISLPAGLIRLDADHYVALLGGEPCYEVMLKLQASLGVKRLLFIGYLDSSAYIPDDKIIVEGGYEADESALEYGLKGGFRPGIDRSIAEAFAQSFSSLSRGK
ncbi:hypothetical protein [Cohnella sp. JJ-181]|uniref:hypothetical protein n=1 Tax=Cohnella rhizoplanae TaxID=2974897 RepID=UPI0022FFC3A6|nr:hypothetical protein [Cohnella sp. JJ-181]CAI6025034.1 hypothetical protein COHCIP112018_00470 [Cohnella sp. JJ-181]